MLAFLPMNTSSDFDLVLIGAGLVGTSLVCALKDLPFRIAILESHLLDLEQPPKANSRPISLSYGSQQLLVQLGVWQCLEAIAVPIRHVHVSAQNAMGRVVFHAEDYQLPALGYVVPFDHLRHALYQKALEHSGLTVISSEALCGVDQQEDHICLQYQRASKKNKLTARLLIATDGSQSKTRSLLGISAQTVDYQEQALTATLELDRSLEIAYERFTALGTIAILPEREKAASLVWTIDPAQQAELLTASEEALCQQLQVIMGHRIGRIRALKKGAQYPLISLLAEKPHEGRALLLGNAAHSFYPIAAQGFNLSLRDVKALSRLLREPQSLLAPKTLFSRYEKERAVDQTHTYRLVHRTQACFDLQIPGLNGLRGLVLSSIEALSPVKNRLAKQSIGLLEPLWN